MTCSSSGAGPDWLGGPTWGLLSAPAADPKLNEFRQLPFSSKASNGAGSGLSPFFIW